MQIYEHTDRCALVWSTLYIYLANRSEFIDLAIVCLCREKQVTDLKDTYEAVTTSYDDIKDKKIIELAK